MNREGDIRAIVAEGQSSRQEIMVVSDYNSSGRGDEMWSSSGPILKVETLGFAN